MSRGCPNETKNQTSTLRSRSCPSQPDIALPSARPPPMRVRSLENRSFLVLVALVTLAFLWTLQGFLLPVFWAVVFAILFTPLYRWFLGAFRGREALASLATLLAVFLLLIVPLAGVGVSVTTEAAGLYERVASGELNVNERIQDVEAMLPRLTRRAARLGIDLDKVRTAAEGSALTVSRGLAAGLLALGQSALSLVLLLAVTFYTLFFFLKDGDALVATLVRALPLGNPREWMILARFAAVTRATVKGSFLVALVQGTIGAVAFAVLGLGSPVLWGVLMAIMSLLPAVGAAIVWAPAALFLVATGDVTKGLILVGVGVGLIGVVDNALRPILVGRDAGMPDYLILLSTLGGIAAFGISGLVIGPVIAGLFLSVWEIFAAEFGGDDPDDPEAEVGVPSVRADTEPEPARVAGEVRDAEASVARADAARDADDDAAGDDAGGSAGRSTAPSEAPGPGTPGSGAPGA